MSLLAELKRRNVAKVGAAYLLVAWLAVQAASIGFPAFDAPAWALRVFILVLLLGFPITVVMAWMFERTPEGLKRDAAPAGDKRIIAVGIVLAALAVAWYYRGQPTVRDHAVPAGEVGAKPAPPAQAAAQTPQSLAVLPFVNMSTDPENGFFADGISEELLNVLAGVEGLEVASRTSAFSFKGKDVPIPQIARELGVRHVLEGSVRKQGGRVRITAQLIDAQTDVHLWSETYDRDLDDIFEVQQEIAQAITRKLEASLGTQAVQVAATTSDLEAYQAFLRGRTRFNQREDMQAAIADLSGAVKRDPRFAEAWTYLAAAWQVLPGYELDVDLAQAKVATRVALARAAELAPGDPMVLALEAGERQDRGDVLGALELLDRAAAAATDSTPVLWRGTLLLQAGYVDEATRAFEQAKRRDPLSGVNNGYLALARLSAGRYAEAEALAREAQRQGWSPALKVVVFDMAARGERERAAALVESFGPPARSSEEVSRDAAIRDLLLRPEKISRSPLLAELNDEFVIASGDFAPLLDRGEREMAKRPDDRLRFWWLRAAWLPSTRALREDPRFYRLADRLGFVPLWEARGFPIGCRPVGEGEGRHLQCPGAAP
jgi:TolB-like protein/Tfp pilus assembly protein PilF